MKRLSGPDWVAHEFMRGLPLSDVEQAAKILRRAPRVCAELDRLKLAACEKQRRRRNLGQR